MEHLATSIVRILQDYKDPVSVSFLAAKLGRPRSQILRYLYKLKEMELIEMEGEENVTLRSA